MSKNIVIIGGGISGLSVAYRLEKLFASDPPNITLLEKSDEIGGKIRTSSFLGHQIDEAADAFLTRVPWGLDLCSELGIAADYISPASSKAYVVVNGRLRPLPLGLVLGVPTKFLSLLKSRIVSPISAIRASLDRIKPDDWPGHDETVGELIRRRLGPEIADKLVDPLIGSINAGDTDLLDLGLVAPQLETAARKNKSLINGLRNQAAQGGDKTGPVFCSFPEGMSHLTNTLRNQLKYTDIQTNIEVNSVLNHANGIKVSAQGIPDVVADAVVIATPANVSSKFFHSVPSVIPLLQQIEFSSVALITLGYKRSEVLNSLNGSGMLVPKNEGLLITACSWASSKWPHWADNKHVVFRVSVGRYGDNRFNAYDDSSLATHVADELKNLLGIEGEFIESRISRWPSSFPQYKRGHEALVDSIDDQIKTHLPGVFLTGSSYRGLGIPACIRQGNETARTVTDYLGQ